MTKIFQTSSYSFSSSAAFKSTTSQFKSSVLKLLDRSASHSPSPAMAVNFTSIKTITASQNLNKIKTTQSIADAFTAQAKTQHNFPMNDIRQGQPEIAFIITNESGTRKAQATLRHWAACNTNQSRPTLHLGVGSIINYPMALSSQSDIIIIADLDKRVIKFHQELVELIRQIPVHQNLASAIRLHIKNTWQTIMNNTLQDHEFDHSWLDPKSLSKLKEMAQNNRIIPLHMNLNDAMDLVRKYKSEDVLEPGQQPKVVIYSSNVGDWIRGRNSSTSDSSLKTENYRQFGERIDNTVANGGCHVYTTIDHRSDPDNCYLQQVVEGKAGLPAFSNLRKSICAKQQN